MTAVADHLWQSSACVAAAWFLTLALRRHRAAVRYAIWFAASAKFLIPFSLLVALGNQFHWRSAPVLAPPPQFAIATLAPLPGSLIAAPSPTHLPAILTTIWLAGIALGALYWARTLLQIRAIRRAATPLDLGLPILALTSTARLEPGIFGIRRPVLILPAGIAERLTREQLDAVLAHELCHVRRKDNLTAAIHLLVETIFWFHPLVWWIRARLVAERERACDEAVLARAADPHTYAEAILRVCQLYFESPVVCVSGITGADLQQRIDAILANRRAQRLTTKRKLLLALVAASIIVAPLGFGIATAPPVRAQSAPDSRPAAFDAASIKPAAPPEPESNNRSRIEYTPLSLTMRNVDLSQCVQWAYAVPFFQVAEANLSRDSYDIYARTGIPVPVSRLRVMLQEFLARRFNLALHRETKMQPVYELLVAKGGAKLPTRKPDDGAVHAAESLPRIENGSFVFHDSTIAHFAAMLPQLRGVELPVVDRTGIAGTYDLVLKSAPEVTRQGDVQALFGIIEEQLGLRLVPAKDPLEVLVIDRAGKPTEN